MSNDLAFVTENINRLCDDDLRRLLITFKKELDTSKARHEKAGVGNFIYTNKIPTTTLYLMKKFIANCLNL